MNHTTRTPKDGTYSFRAVQPYGPAVPQCVTVEAGHVTTWKTGEGEHVSVTRPQTAALRDRLTAALVETLTGRTRYGASTITHTA